MFPLELINQFALGNGSVFVGAGLSMGAGLPSWAKLVEPLTQALAQEIEEREPRSPSDFEQWHRSLPDIAQYYENISGRPALLGHAMRTLGGRKTTPTEIHEKLINLPVQRIFTTNFDTLLETAFREHDISFQKIITHQQLALMDSSSGKLLVKLHGDLESPETLVITSNDYENYFSRHPGIANLLGMDLHTRTVLFLGYSFNDHNLRMILSQVSREAGDLRRRLFTVQFNAGLLEQREFNRRGIEVINLQADLGRATEALDNWLEELMRRVRESPLRQLTTLQLFTAIGFINGNLPSRSGEFLGREAEFARVRKGLESRYPLVSIKGFAGVGKTSLAIQVGWACSLDRSKFATGAVIFEYIVWISAEGKPDQKRWLDDVLNAIAITTNSPGITQREREEKEKQIQKILESYKTLIILDNFEVMEDDPELIEWLERIPYPSKILVTTREGRPELEPIAAWTVYLKGLELPQAVELLRRQSSLEGMTDRNLRDLALATDGNPQVMKLAVGLAQDGMADPEEFIKQLDDPDKNPHEVFEKLFLGSWKRLLEPARQILRVTPLFGVHSISKEALRAAAGLAPDDFSQGSYQCLKFGLLEEYNSRYVIHPMTRAFARHRLNTHKTLKQEARRRCTEYFLEFVRDRVKRPQPEPPYWNALVRVEMVEALNPEWPSIQQVLTWADEDGQDENLVELVMLLVHYMDTQFFNLERLEYVKKAIAALQRLALQKEALPCKEQEALLRIDALGWTYVEVLELDRARAEICQGLKTAQYFKIAQRDDLCALGRAWGARVEVEDKEKDFVKAGRLIDEARAIECSPWIRFRVNMAAGDIALKKGGWQNAEDALHFYQRAAREAESYGGEGYGYQTMPRIGLAHLELGQIKDAEQNFVELSGLEQIPIGKLYAEYGLALVELRRGNQEEAQAMLSDVKAKLSRRTKSNLNLLLRLIEDQEARMQARKEPA